MSDKATSHDHRWAVGLCVLLVLLLVGGTIGGWAYGARRQRLAVEALTGPGVIAAPMAPPSYRVASGATGTFHSGSGGWAPGMFNAGSVEYGFQLDDNLDPIAADPPGPQWLRQWLGIDYLATVRGATIKQLSDDSLKALRALTGLRSLQIQPLMFAAPPVFSSGAPAIDNGPSIGPVMALLPNFTMLEKLVLAGAPASDDDLAVLPKLPRLRILDLSGCQAITDPGLAHVGEIAGLKSLSLTSPTTLTDAGLEKLSGLKNLETLRLYLQDQPLGLKFLSGLANLEELQCWGLTDASFTSLSSAPKLKKLSLVQCQQLSSAGLKHLGDFSSLEVLYFAIMPGLDDDALARIAELPKLRELVIQGQMSHLADTGLESLSHSSSLRTLFLFGCPKLTDEGLAHLAALENIGQLNIDAYQPDQFSSQAVDNLRASLPKCRFHYQKRTSSPAAGSSP